MIVLAFLGFTNFSHSLPLNDKLLHFMCFMLATAVFYFIIDVDEEARRIWFWRHAGLLFTGFICFFCGGILSEFVQSMLPYKEFQFGDVVANILGSSVGLYVSYHLERYYRHRREISRLYRPLESGSDDEESDAESPSGTLLLPMHHRSDSNNASILPASSSQRTKQSKSVRFTDVWDEREELFGIGDSDDEDVGDATLAKDANGSKAHGSGINDGPEPVTPTSHGPIPKIFITDS
ncbi:hypothetical protein ONZ45_g8733 [Pleurotus djamor]|nr:hypothetical protein ONZ45_g8733 [Pleurotus djamor]